MSMQPTTNAAGQQILNPLALPTPAAVTPPDANALLSPIYNQAQNQVQGNADAITRALQTQQANSDARLASLAGTLGAPSQGLAQAVAIPNSTIANALTRQAGMTQAQEDTLANSRAAQTTGLTDNLQHLAAAASLQRQLSDAAAQSRAMQQDAQLENQSLAQQKDYASTAISLANLEKAQEMVNYEAQRAAAAARASSAKSTGALTAYQAAMLGLDASKLQNSEGNAQQTAMANAINSFDNLTNKGTAPHGTGVYTQALNLINSIYGSQYPDLSKQIAADYGLSPNGTPLATNSPAAPGGGKTFGVSPGFSNESWFGGNGANSLVHLGPSNPLRFLNNLPLGIGAPKASQTKTTKK